MHEGATGSGMNFVETIKAKMVCRGSEDAGESKRDALAHTAGVNQPTLSRWQRLAGHSPVDAARQADEAELKDRRYSTSSAAASASALAFRRSSCSNCLKRCACGDFAGSFRSRSDSTDAGHEPRNRSWCRPRRRSSDAPRPAVYFDEYAHLALRRVSHPPASAHDSACAGCSAYVLRRAFRACVTRMRASRRTRSKRSAAAVSAARVREAARTRSPGLRRAGAVTRGSGAPRRAPSRPAYEQPRPPVQLWSMRGAEQRCTLAVLRRTPRASTPPTLSVARVAARVARGAVPFGASACLALNREQHRGAPLRRRRGCWDACGEQSCRWSDADEQRARFSEAAHPLGLPGRRLGAECRRRATAARGHEKKSGAREAPDFSVTWCVRTTPLLLPIGRGALFG